jgi:hypothetical protein
MNREQYKSVRKGQPKRKAKTAESKRRTATGAKRSSSYGTPELRAAYSAKTEWVRNVIPKLKKGQ